MNDMTPSNTPPPPREEDYDGPSAVAIRNPFGDGGQEVTVLGAMAAAEAQRSVAEVQARMIIARSNPRNQRRAMEAIMNDCTRQTLAEKGLYEYKRGGQVVTGPSIRLAEAVAQRWGNIASGIKELSRSNHVSECVAYAWDLESGYYDERVFQVRHWRDTKKSESNPAGGYLLTDERDIYELFANMGQRRKRACLLTVIPGDVVEVAVDACQATLRANVDLSPEYLKGMLGAFAAIGVTRAMIEAKIQSSFDAIRPAQVLQLHKIFASIKDEMSGPGDWFDAEATGAPGTSKAWSQIEQRHAETKTTKAATKPKAETKKDEPKVDPLLIQMPQTPQGSPHIPNYIALVTAALGAMTTQAQVDAWVTVNMPVYKEIDGVPPIVMATRQRITPPAPDVPTSAASGASGTTDAQPSDAATTGTGAPEFDGWLLDANGDPDGEEPFSNAVAFASALANRITNRPEEKAALLAQNADGMADASTADAAAAEIIAGLTAEEEGADVGEEETTAEPVVVEVPRRGGSLDAKGYLAAMRPEIAKLTAATYLDFVAANTANLHQTPLSTRSLIVKDLLAAAKALGIEAPPMLSQSLVPNGQGQAAVNADQTAAQQTKADEDQDLRSARNRIMDIQDCKDLPTLEAYRDSAALKQFGVRMNELSRKDLLDMVRAAYAEREAKLKGGAAS